MFSCRLCSEKDLRIKDKNDEIIRLSEQLQMFRQLAFPQIDKAVVPNTLEFDCLVSGSEQVSQEDISREADALLSGSYDNTQVDI
jgi:hypothetical protein